MLRRRSCRSADISTCPMCKKVVEYGVSCHGCATWFHATETCCGDLLSNAFLRAGREPWFCLNCFPKEGEVVPSDPLKPPALLADLVEWRRAFRIVTHSCGGCRRQVSLAAEASIRSA